MARTKSPATWQEAARILNAVDPEYWNGGALGRIFGKAHASVWWALHPELREALEQDRNQERKEARRVARARKLGQRTADAGAARRGSDTDQWRIPG